MAIVKANIVTEGLSGGLGRIVAKHYADKTVITQKPRPSRFPRSTSQKQNSRRFADAVVYAAKALQDPAAAAKIKKKGYNNTRLQFIREYMQAGKPQTLSNRSPRYYSQTQLEALGCNGRQLNAIAYMRSKKQMSNAIYQQLNNISKSTATRDLQQLINCNIIRSTGHKGAGARYALCSPPKNNH
ncbi:hypothetical protein [Filimonas effusa]|uniref:DeoR family transcriptional regulator n=1 Tax=Filimonas effusa TaxID=2508721 RepID=A0A4Q1D6Y9_9BACT|nr:hypothetical protein [Filimonas effusa]RXK83683.1 hypothetical protein ESB13_16515 [Filimonas effusa]